MPKKTGYTLVDQALQGLDYTELSRLGKKGVASKKRKQFFRINKMLRGAAQAARDAHIDPHQIED